MADFRRKIEIAKEVREASQRRPLPFAFPSFPAQPARKCPCCGQPQTSRRWS